MGWKEEKEARNKETGLNEERKRKIEEVGRKTRGK